MSEFNKNSIRGMSGIQNSHDLFPFENTPFDTDMVQTELVCGPMFAGKTTALIARHETLTEYNVAHCILSPAFDKRHNGVIISHDDKRIEDVDVVGNVSELLKTLNRRSQTVLEKNTYAYSKVFEILVDEIQFFDKDFRDNEFLENLAKWSNVFAKENNCLVSITFFGLDMDTDQKYWPLISRLLPWVESRRELKATCMTCGEDAPYTIRKNGGKAVSETGGADIYGACCRRHLLKSLKSQETESRKSVA